MATDQDGDWEGDGESDGESDGEGDADPEQDEDDVDEDEPPSFISRVVEEARQKHWIHPAWTISFWNTQT